IANNMLCAANLVLVSEAVRLAKAAGVAPNKLLEGINAGSGRSAVSEVNFPRWILSDAFDSGFTMGLMRKDVALAAALAAETETPIPGFAPIAALWRYSAARLADEADFNEIARTDP
ncbi:MAG: NAD-binding protein, partial [Pseudomonadota bacterium]